MATTSNPAPPIWHDDGTVTLWHDDSPGVRLRVRPCLWRRLGLIRHPFTTLGERGRYYRDRRTGPTPRHSRRKR
jgi:hypothetical protein